MKASALFFVCLIGVALCIPVDQSAAADSQITLADLEREQIEPLIVPEQLTDEQDVARSKRFIFVHKLALAKALKLGIGALGVAGAVLATKGVLGNILDLPHRRSFFKPRLLNFPNGGYFTNQLFR